MSKYKAIFNEEEQDAIFETEEDAEEYALYLSSCTKEGAYLTLTMILYYTIKIRIIKI